MNEYWGEYTVEQGNQPMLLCPECVLKRENRGEVLKRISDPEGPHYDCHDCGAELPHGMVA